MIQNQTYEQTLGGKELAFPLLGYSDSVEGRNGDQSISCACLNVLGKVPYNPDWCGGTRPGLIKVSTAVCESPSAIFTIPWRGEDGVLHEAVVVVDGLVLKVANGDVFSDLKGVIVTDDGDYLVCDKDFRIVVVDSAVAEAGCPVGCVMNGKLYFRSAGGVKSYDPSTGIVANVLSDAYGASAMCLWRGRIVLYGSDNVVHFSAVLDAGDFDVGKHFETSANATDISLAEVGKLGGKVTAFIPFNDNIAYIATANTLWRLSDDAIGGTLVRLSSELGVVQRTAWALGDGEVAFLSHDGVYYVNGEGVISALELIFENRVKRSVFAMTRPDLSKQWTLGYDRTIRGYLVCAVSATDAIDDAWVIDEGRSVWPTAFAKDRKPICFARREFTDSVSELLIACKDGHVRKFSRDRADDDLGAISSAVALGPVVHTTCATEDAFIAEVSVDLDVNNTVAGTKMSVVVGDNAHIAINRAQAFVDWIKNGCIGDAPNEKKRYAVAAGWNHVVRPRCRGNAFVAVIWNKDARFSLSRLSVVSRGCGRIRF